ncbi:hypothetical protein C4D60_Mb08t12020 [Musa balbisiana]|uniref:Uncharacterized protein n=1 Tax=Musa balbisiana TaxID=52838 RepID=A0A4S8K356_MUSBA|nr:hypothetical protein C4D60_Mb08t12020 [Musa balbisiana]
MLLFNGVVPAIVQRLEDGKQPVGDVGRCPLKKLLLKELVVVHEDRKVGECRKSLQGQLQQLLNYLLQLSSHSSEFFFFVPYE